MKRMKTFFIYALLIAALWIFSDIIIYLTINGTYKTKEARVYVSSPEITITENKATYVNGVVKGNINNSTDKIIDDVYLKIDMYSPRDVNLGTKYIKIDNLQVDESQNFEIWYEFTDVDYVTVRITDDASNISETEISSHKITLYLLFGKLMLLYFM